MDRLFSFSIYFLYNIFVSSKEGVAAKTISSITLHMSKEKLILGAVYMAVALVIATQQRDAPDEISISKESDRKLSL